MRSERAHAACGKGASVASRVAKVLDQIRPALQSDGGDVELIEVDASGVVRLRFQGACVGCPSSSMTLVMGIERNLMEQVPEVTSVVAV